MEFAEQDFDLRVITLHDLWDIFRRKFVLMVLAAVVVAGGAFAYKQITFVPQYESTATLYLVNQNGEEDRDSSAATYNNFNLALKLVNDCNHLIKSHSVLDQVISTLNLDMSYNQLYSAVTVVNPEETRILEVTAVADTPEEAKRIVDEICEVGTAKIEEAMGFEQAKLYEYGVLNQKPCNTTSLMMYALLGVVAAVLVYSFFLIRFLLDDRIRTDEDIERVLGLSILGDIPNADNPKKGRGYGKYGKYYGKKGYGDTPYGQAPAPAARPQGSLPGAKPAAHGGVHGKGNAGAFGGQQQNATQGGARGAGQVNPAGRVAQQGGARAGARTDAKARGAAGAAGASGASGAWAPSQSARRDR